MSSRTRSLALAAMLLLGVAVAIPHTSATTQAQDSATAEATASPDAYGGTVEKDVLIEDSDETSAPGETLSLTRYTIPAGAKLPVHYHPGVQMASVVSGELTYHVIEGKLYVVRADGTKVTYESGATVVFTAGDSWEEPEGMIHYAENLGDEPVILISTALLETDKDATILVEGTPAPTTATPVG
ncbi:MAG: cupin domain-containing protein [Thermomicrobiales bacterium]